MCIKIGMLRSIIRLVRVWCGILVSAAGFIDYGCSFECLVVGIQNKAVYANVWDTICESMGECTQVYNCIQFITEIDQS